MFSEQRELNNAVTTWKTPSPVNILGVFAQPLCFVIGLQLNAFVKTNGPVSDEWWGLWGLEGFERMKSSYCKERCQRCESWLPCHQGWQCWQWWECYLPAVLMFVIVLDFSHCAPFVINTPSIVDKPRWCNFVSTAEVEWRQLPYMIERMRFILLTIDRAILEGQNHWLDRGKNQ